VRLDPHDAALWALVAISLVLTGALLTPGTVGVEERGVVLTAIAAVLLAVGWRVRARRSGGDDDDRGA
jgi:hypothetical protein